MTLQMDQHLDELNDDDDDDDDDKNDEEEKPSEHENITISMIQPKQAQDPDSKEDDMIEVNESGQSEIEYHDKEEKESTTDQPCLLWNDLNLSYESSAVENDERSPVHDTETTKSKDLAKSVDNSHDHES